MSSKGSQDVSPPTESTDLPQVQEPPEADKPSIKSYRFCRRPFHCCDLMVHVLDRKGQILADLEVESKDISSHGIMFLHSQMLVSEQRVLIEIPTSDGFLSVHGRVVRCRYIDNMMHEIGVEFLAANALA